MQKILFTTVCRPFGGPGEGDSVSAELFHAQVTRAQGIFSFRQVIRCWGLDYIAENIEVPAVVLHYPSKRELIKELKSREFDYVGINFVVSTFHKVREMAPLIRKYAPKAKIILGGYGTVLPDELMAPYSDLVCREEGIGFMRRLLGEDTLKPIKHPYLPIKSPRFYSYQMKTKVAHITGGLGCPNGCDFCCTSHFFNRKYIPFIKSGKELYDTIMRLSAEAVSKGDIISSFIIIDEDFFIHTKRAREFLECVRKGGKNLNLMGFGSIRGLSQFTADEIAEMGFDTIWTAFEGEKAGYGKLEGEPIEELYKSLKSRGISLLSSMIIGFPYQNADIIWSEFNCLMELVPTYSQFLIYFAFPGTPFHKQVIEENRYLPKYTENPDLRKWDGFAMHFKHPNLDPNELETIQKRMFRQDFTQLGPSIVRAVRVWFEGYKNLRSSQNTLLKQQSDRMRNYVKNAIPGLIPAIVFGPNRQRREEAYELCKEITNEMGGTNLTEIIQCGAVILLASWTWLAMKLNAFQQPRLTKIQHRIEKSRIVFWNIGKIVEPIAVFIRDMVQNVNWMGHKLFGKLSRSRENFSAKIVTTKVASKIVKYVAPAEVEQP